MRSIFMLPLTRTAHLFILLMIYLLLLIACGGGGGAGGAGPPGTITVYVSDAKPLLPAGATNLFVTFEELSVHKSGGDWASLPLVTSPYTIDLLQFSDGRITELAPPTRLEDGKYTQIRLQVSSAFIRFINGKESQVKIPSSNLKTDKNFDFDAQYPSAVDIVIDFDLSQSLVVRGQGSYQLKPVLHINETYRAATIFGYINNFSFVGDQAAVVTVFAWANQEEYTRIAVSKSNFENPTEFGIYWLVPNQSYNIEIDIDPDSGNGPEYSEDVARGNLGPGAIFELNSGNPIVVR
jgi:Domain of unknown function (DUF4382)